MKAPGESESDQAFDATKRLAEAFPDRLGAIQQARDISPEFRELCDDFLECDRILTRMRAERIMQNPRIPEYEEMRTRLEEEVIDWLQTRPANPLHRDRSDVE